MRAPENRWQKYSQRRKENCCCKNTGADRAEEDRIPFHHVGGKLQVCRIVRQLHGLYLIRSDENCQNSHICQHGKHRRSPPAFQSGQSFVFIFLVLFHYGNYLDYRKSKGDAQNSFLMSTRCQYSTATDARRMSRQNVGSSVVEDTENFTASTSYPFAVFMSQAVQSFNM